MTAHCPGFVQALQYKVVGLNHRGKVRPKEKLYNTTSGELTFA